jgi:hypothetical protein
MKYGLSAPGVGPLGIGAEMFTDDHPDRAVSKSPFRFIAYMFLLFIPFGFDYLVAGDVNGALLKFFLYFIPILWPIASILTIYNWGRATFATRDLFDNGTYRIFPFNVLGMATYGYSRMGPINVPFGGDGTIYGTLMDFFSYIGATISKIFYWIITPIIWLFNIIIGPLKILVQQIVIIFTTIVLPVLVQTGKAIINVFTLGAGAAVEASAKAVETGAVAASKVAETVGTVSQEVTKTVKEIAPKARNVAMEVGTQLQETAKAVGPSVKVMAKNIGNIGEKSADIVSTYGSIGTTLGHEFKEGVEGADKLIDSINSAKTNPVGDATKSLGSASKAVEGSLDKLVTPEGLTALASTAPAAAVASASMQTGGGSSDEFSLTSMALFALFVLVLGGGTYIAIRRLNNDTPLFQKDGPADKERRKRNDTPPKP